MSRPRASLLLLAVLCSSLASCGNGGMPELGATKPGSLATLSPADLCARLGWTCGPASDGFGRIVDCGVCEAPEWCGGDGIHGRCGGVVKPCVPRTCAELGLTCGPQGDGCGAQIDCGTCAEGDRCGIDAPSTCGKLPSCENLCLQQVRCAPGVTTTVTGKVVAPTRPEFGPADPIYDALVYVPNGVVAPFAPGVSCEQCGAQVSGHPLVIGHSGADGTFTLSNVPVGSGIPLVIQIGRWRRQVSIDVLPCVENTLDAERTRLPRNQAEGDIPRMAMVTGSADPLECVLRKIGIDDAEFTAPSPEGGSGRVQMYVANGSTLPDAAPAPQLWGQGGDLSLFDVVLFACEGSQIEKPSWAQQNVVDFANQGGRIFATHFSYTWLYDAPPFAGTGTWKANAKPGKMQTEFSGIVDTSFARGKAFAEWLVVVSASENADFPRVTIDVARTDLLSVHPPGQRWIYTEAPDPVTVQHYTFDTPLDATDGGQCGRVLFSDFHVTAHTGGGGNQGGPQPVFPDECDDVPLSPQEKVLEFALFDLSSCVPGGKSGLCTPLTCDALGIHCGPAGDGCGGLLDCGTCPVGRSCGLGGIPSVCGAPPSPCVPLTCADAGFHCGPAGDGCGALTSCGNCPSGTRCGGGGEAGVCG